MLVFNFSREYLDGVSRVNEVASVLVECIEDLEGVLLVAFTESLLPIIPYQLIHTGILSLDAAGDLPAVSEVHCTQA